MPFVQISILKGKSPESILNISNSIHQALVEEFGIPELDKFQVINEVNEGYLVYPPEYLGIPHSKDIIYIHITAKIGRTVEMKKKLYAKIATFIRDKENISQDDVFIVLSENSEENWSFGRGKAQLVEK
jgi:phenylpyruvate tautomerase PptA (4-oxalocrotonate tautomerase family)